MYTGLTQRLTKHNSCTHSATESGLTMSEQSGAKWPLVELATTSPAVVLDIVK